MAKPEVVGLDPKTEVVNEDGELDRGEPTDRWDGGSHERKGGPFRDLWFAKPDEELPVEKDTIFRIYSMTKATSMAALMLSEEEKRSRSIVQIFYT